MLGARHIAVCAVAAGAILSAAAARAQGAATTRLLILEAEERRAPTAADVALIRSNARNSNPDTARIAIRALGRLERASLIADILPGLRHQLPEVRVEAASALAQATRSLANGNSASVVTSTAAALMARLNVEGDASVRGAICEALARLPYKVAADAARAETAIVDLGTHTTVVADRLGVAKALEAFVRVQAAVRTPDHGTIALLQQLGRLGSPTSGAELRDARVRRLAVAALISSRRIDADLIERAAIDPDPQVRRLAMRAIAESGAAAHKAHDGLVDPSPMVRIDALRALGRLGGEVCAAATASAADVDMNTALVAIDQLAACAAAPAAVAALARIAGETADIAVPRGWHRQAHALLALATAAPEQARTALPTYVAASQWQVRAYAARTATTLGDRPSLDALSRDVDDRVANLALSGLARQGRPRRMAKREPAAPVTADEMRRMASPRARIVVRDVGTLEIALFTTEAPGSVVRFARLAESGYYNGLSFDRHLPNDVAQAGDNGGETTTFQSREAGNWPHVKGSLGMAAPDTNDGQFFINLVDNPRYDHEYTVFGQVLNGADVVERLLEGDVIESIVVVP